MYILFLCMNEQTEWTLFYNLNKNIAVREIESFSWIYVTESQRNTLMKIMAS